MQNFNLEEFEQTGVYEIKNLVNGKVYIGSTVMSFKKRLNHHRSLLRAGTHKNQYLQRAWDKYGEENFQFSILKVVDECCTLEEEQIYLDEVKSEYNINPLASGTPNMSQETIEKRTATFTAFMEQAMKYYYKVKDKEITINEVPEKYRQSIEGRLNYTVWNKGLTGKDFDYSYLRVPKTVTDKVLEARKKKQKAAREKLGKVYVYDADFNFLAEFNSSKEIEEWSHTEENNWPIKSRFSGEERLGVPVKVLQNTNILKSCRDKISYKGLYFRREEIISELSLLNSC